MGEVYDFAININTNDYLERDAVIIIDENDLEEPLETPMTQPRVYFRCGSISAFLHRLFGEYYLCMIHFK